MICTPFFIFTAIKLPECLSIQHIFRRTCWDRSSCYGPPPAPCQRSTSQSVHLHHINQRRAPGTVPGYPSVRGGKRKVLVWTQTMDNNGFYVWHDWCCPSLRARVTQCRGFSLGGWFSWGFECISCLMSCLFSVLLWCSALIGSTWPLLGGPSFLYKASSLLCACCRCALSLPFLLPFGLTEFSGVFREGPVLTVFISQGLGETYLCVLVHVHVHVPLSTLGLSGWRWRRCRVSV